MLFQYVTISGEHLRNTTGFFSPRRARVQLPHIFVAELTLVYGRYNELVHGGFPLVNIHIMENHHFHIF